MKKNIAQTNEQSQKHPIEFMNSLQLSLDFGENPMNKTTANSIKNLPDDLAFYMPSPLDSTEDLAAGESTKNDRFLFKELPTAFIGRGETRGFRFKQIMKSDCAYIFEVRQPYQDLPPHFEIFRRIYDHRFNKISYPKSNSFGVAGWTTRTMEEAINRLDSTTTLVKNKKS